MCRCHGPADDLRQKLELMFPDHKTLVCMGVDLEVARPEQFDGLEL